MRVQIQGKPHMFQKMLLQSRCLLSRKTTDRGEVALNFVMLAVGVLIGLVTVWGSLAFWTYISP